MQKKSGLSQGVTHQTVDENHLGQRLDNYLMYFLKGVPRSRIYSIIRKGEVRVNKKRAKPTQKLLLGDCVRIPPVTLDEKKDLEISDNLKERLLSAIIYQDKDFIVLHKPEGMAVHGGSGLSFAVIEGMRLATGLPNLELAHRLDRDTSGCLLIAKNRQALVEIHKSLRLKQVKKRYLALLAYPWKGAKQKIIDKPLLKNTLNGGERMVCVSEEGKPAKTMFQLVKNFKECCLVAAYPVTGRTHQIRVHAQSMGHPIIGDKKYGTTDPALSSALLKAPRLFLHANQLNFEYLSTPYFFDVPVDAKWENYINELY